MMASADTSSFKPRIVLQFNVVSHEKKDQDLVDVRGTVYLSDAHGRSYGRVGSLYHEGSLPRLYAVKPGSAFKESMKLYLDLDSERLEMIERLRRGGDLFLQINLYYITVNAEEPVSNLRWQSAKVRDKTDAINIKISQTDWVKILEELHYGKYLVLEIPLELPEVSSELLKKGLSNLKEARLALNEGRYRDVIDACRKSIDRINDAIKEWANTTKLVFTEEENARIQNAKEKDRERIRERIRLERLLQDPVKAEEVQRLKSQVYSLYSSFAVHERVKKEVDRIDAKMALHIAYSLFEFFSRRLSRGP